MNPLLMAGWIAMLVTGLNMLPVSQLDGGHVAYALFGRHAHWLARIAAAASLAAIVLFQQYGFGLMFLLVMLLGVRHPPTADDRVPLGWPRRLFGVFSLAIPIVCLSPLPELGWQPPGNSPASNQRAPQGPESQEKVPQEPGGKIPAPRRPGDRIVRGTADDAVSHALKQCEHQHAKCKAGAAAPEMAAIRTATG